MRHHPSRGFSRLGRLLVAATLLAAGIGVWASASAQSPTAATLKVESATPTSLTVTWDEVEGAAGYTIRWRLVGGSGFEPGVAAPNRRHQITGLLAGREYVVQVIASDANGALLARLRGSFRLRLSTPRDFAVTAASAGSLTVAWTKPLGWEPTAYELRWRRQTDTPFLGSVRIAGGATSYTLTGLDDQTEYILNMVALNDADNQSYDVSDRGWAVAPLTFRLSASSENCPANTKTDLTWELSGGLKPYRFWVQGQRIDPETTHSLRVRCGALPSNPPADDPMAKPTKTFGGRLLDGRGVEITAEATVNLVTLSAPAEASGSVELRWTPPAEWTPVGYRLRWRLPGSLEFLGQVNLGADARSYTLSGLEADREYVLRLTAVHRDGPESRADTARVSTYPPLMITLSSSRELCTANTLTELSWEISGGKPPYKLTIDGETVNPNVDTHRLSCGPIPTDPVTRDPANNPSRTFSATVMDAQSVSASSTAEIEVDLLSPLAAPSDFHTARYEGHVTISWTRIPGAGLPYVNSEFGSYFARWRQSGTTAWTYDYVRDFGSHKAATWQLRSLPEGTLYEFSLAALRHPIEQHSHDALRWSAIDTFRTLEDPQNVQVAIDGDTLTVSWDPQADGLPHRYQVSLLGPTGRDDHFARYMPGDSHTVTFTTVPYDTELQVLVLLFTADVESPHVFKTVRTGPAPEDWERPSTGAPQNVSTSVTHDSVTVRWAHP